MTQLVLVDKFDQVIGSEEKIAAHKKGLLHRAFSIFIYRQTPSGIEVLLHKRASSKYHSPSLWTNSCCSHAKFRESLLETAFNRLQEELGYTSSSLEKIGECYYHIECLNGLIEHEYDHIFITEYNDSEFNLNADEVDSIKWFSINDVNSALEKEPTSFTPWFDKVWQVLLNSTNWGNY